MTEESNTVQTLKSLMVSLRACANYFDESHEYVRMNELDKAYRIFEKLIPIVSSRGDIHKEKQELIDAIDMTAKMEPFQLKA